MAGRSVDNEELITQLKSQYNSVIIDIEKEFKKQIGVITKSVETFENVLNVFNDGDFRSGTALNTVIDAFRSNKVNSDLILLCYTGNAELVKITEDFRLHYRVALYDAVSVIDAVYRKIERDLLADELLKIAITTQEGRKREVAGMLSNLIDLYQEAKHMKDKMSNYELYLREASFTYNRLLSLFKKEFDSPDGSLPLGFGEDVGELV